MEQIIHKIPEGFKIKINNLYLKQILTETTPVSPTVWIKFQGTKQYEFDWDTSFDLMRVLSDKLQDFHDMIAITCSKYNSQVTYCCERCHQFTIQEYWTEQGVYNCENDEIDPKIPRICHCLIDELKEQSRVEEGDLCDDCKNYKNPGSCFMCCFRDENKQQSLYEPLTPTE
jgi:hypothetical protein